MQEIDNQLKIGYAVLVADINGDKSRTSCDEPTVHRVRAFDIDGDSKPEIVHVPLQGRGATAKGNYTDGKPVRIMAYKVPKDPEKPENWKPMVLSEEFHVCHNFWPVFARNGPELRAIYVTAYEGVFAIVPENKKWFTLQKGEGNQANPKGSRGASEVKASHSFGLDLLATIEPWHGNQVVIYKLRPPENLVTPHGVKIPAATST